MSQVNVYYWNARPNYGDRLALNLIRHFCNREVEWSEIPFADAIVTGSIMEQIPASWPGIVAGAGILVGTSRVCFDRADVLGVRGPLTLERITCKRRKSKVTIGDPGLLSDELVDITTRDRQLGILPHWTDTRLANEGVFQQYNPLIISPCDEPLTVIEKVGRCEKLVTSSLHGVVLADALGIPRRFEMSPRMLPEEGGAFKYRDYAASVGVPFEVGVTQKPDRNKISDMKSALFEMFDEVRRLLP